MRAVLQRVTDASVEVASEIVGQIGQGMLIMIGVAASDSERDADYLADKVIGLRIFEDSLGKMNLAIGDIGGSLLVVSQFTLYGDARKGRRPSYSDAARPDEANRLYEYFVDRLRISGLQVETGIFQADMKVRLVNDGPVTILLDSAKLF